MISNSLNVGDFWVEVFTKIYRCEIKHKRCSIQLNSFTFQKLYKFVDTAVLSSDSTFPIRVVGDDCMIFGVKSIINENLEDNVIEYLPSKHKTTLK